MGLSTNDDDYEHGLRLSKTVILKRLRADALPEDDKLPSATALEGDAKEYEKHPETEGVLKRPYT